MYLSSNIIVLAILLVAGTGWCVIVLRRLPNDLAELREQLAKYRASRNPDAARKFETVTALRNYQKECAAEFWSSLAIHICFFWPVTVLIIALFLVPAIWGIAARILSAFK